MADKNSFQSFKSFSNSQNLLSDSELEANWQLICQAKDDIIWREWFFNKIDKILDINANSVAARTSNNNSSNVHPTLKNVTCVFGQAGSGKTFLIQLLTQIKRFQDRILMPFYCKFTSSTPTDFLSEFERQIQEVFNLRASPNVLPNYNVNFRENSLRLLNSLSNDSSQVHKFQLNSKRYLLLVDSIDLRPDICELISSNLHAFPNWLHVIITARPKRYRGITKMFSGARKIVLDDIKKSNVYNDLMTMMNFLVQNKHQITPDPAAHLSKQVTSKILNKSNGSILYVKILLDCLERNIFNVQQLDFVGATLNGLYLAIFTKLFNGNPQFEADYKAILSLIDRINCFKISVAELKAKLNLDDDYLGPLLDHLFLHCLIVFSEDNSHIRLIHSSLFEWLSDIKHCSPRFVCHSHFNQQSEVLLKARNCINNKYINDNDDSVNDISDDMLYEKDLNEPGHLASVNDNIGLGYSQIEKSCLPYLDDVKPARGDFDRLKQHQASVFKSDSAVSPFGTAGLLGGGNALEPNMTNQSLRSAQLKHGFHPNDDDCLVESEEEQLDQEHCDLSKQDISKEYLSKLYQKFESALHLSDTKTLGSILSRYSNVIINQNFIEGKTPIYWAIKKSNMKLVELFVEHNADVNAVCDPQWQYNPLIVALMQHSYDICELLLENDADVEQLDRYSMPPILHAILVNCSSEIIKLLLYWGAHTDFIDEAGRSLLHFAANEPKTWPETISLLLTVGCDEMHRDNTGQTALHMCAANGSLENVEVLVEFGGDKLVHTQDKSGQLPLHVAISKDNADVCAPLITSRSINVMAHSGDSPLRIAILSYYLDLAQVLILKGADINYKDADGRSIIYCVVAFTHSTLEQKGPPFFNVSTLYKNGPEEYLETAVKTIEFLARFGVDLEAKDMEGRTSIHVAAWNGSILLVESLIQLGSDINAVDNENRTPLLMSSWNGHLEVVRMLIDSGANVNHVSSTQGATALLVAAQQGHMETCAFLLRAGSNVTHRDLYGRDARDVALNCGHTDIVTLLDGYIVESQCSTLGNQEISNAGEFNSNTATGHSSSIKLSKYDPRFYSSSNSVPNKKGNKKNKSISKLSKILH